MNIFFAMGRVISEDAIFNSMKNLGFSVTAWKQELIDVDYDTEYLKNLTSEIMKAQYDIIFSVNYKPIIARACNLLKIKYVSWTVDSPHFPLFSETLKYSTNRVFIFDFALYSRFADYNPGNIFHLPLGCNFSTWSNIKMTPNDYNNYNYDISFIGSLYTELSLYTQAKTMMTEHTYGYVEGLVAAQSKIYGYNLFNDTVTKELAMKIKNEIDWEPFKEDYEEDIKYVISEMLLGTRVSELERISVLNLLAHHFKTHLYTGSDTSPLTNVICHGLADSIKMMPKIFKASKINLNITSKPIQTGVPLRALDIMACEGFMISNYQVEFAEQFDIGSEVILYTSMDELVELAHYFLSHENERKEIAHNGFLAVKERFTFEIQLEKLFKKI